MSKTLTDLEVLFEEHQQTARQLRVLSIKKRRKKLQILKRWLLGHRHELHLAVFQDFRKPATEVDIMELYPLLTEIRHAIHYLKDWTAPRRIDSSLSYLGTRAEVHYEPKGTTLVIAPWNYPLLLAVGPVISSIAAGNTVILKPSEYAPAVNLLLSDMFRELYSEEEVAIVNGEADVARQLLQLPFDHIFFTGSPAIGKEVMKAAAVHLSSVTLELGGKSPVIMDESADVEDAVRKICWSKWVNAGQTCVAPDYVWIPETKKDRFLELLQRYSQQMFPNPESYTAIINSKHYERLQMLYKDALSKGARLVFGKDPERDQNRMWPIVVTEVNEQMHLMQEEIFGPILPVLTYTKMDSVIDFINARPKPLALYVFSRSRSVQTRILRETSSGGMVFNDAVLQFGHPHLPAGGIGNSGMGRAHGHAGFLAFSHEKSVLRQRVGFTILSLVYPPYSGLKKKMVALMLRYF